MRRLRCLFFTILLLLLPGCKASEYPLAIYRIEGLDYYMVKVYFRAPKDDLAEERNLLPCVSGDGEPGRFYQDKQSGLEFGGSIEPLGQDGSQFLYSSVLVASIYERR